MALEESENTQKLCDSVIKKMVVLQKLANNLGEAWLENPDPKTVAMIKAVVLVLP
jgi:hypothetical protein